MDNCIFCKIISNEIPSHTLYEDDEFKVILDSFPGSIGHSLVIPKNHVENIFEIDAEQAGRLFALATRLSIPLKEAFHFLDMNILQNNGTLAGQSVCHFHVHLIPRYENDSIKIWWETLKPSSDEFNMAVGKFMQNLK